jgi:hypothetical protein
MATGTNTLLDTGTVALPVPDGGTGVASTTAYAVVCGGTSSTAALQPVASVGTSGQVLTSNGAGALPTFQAAGGGGGLTFVDVGSTPQAISVNNLYFTDNGSTQVIYTLPTTVTKGSIFQIVGSSSGGWQITQASGQRIFGGNLATTLGATGTLTSSQALDSVMLICTVANTTFQVIAYSGNPIAA